MTTSTAGLSPTAEMAVVGTTATVMMRLVRFVENTRKKVYYCNGEKYDKKAKIKRKNGYK
jgi:hypothetical protein